MNKKDKDLLNCFSDKPSDLVFWSFRYFLGRRTIHACAFARDLAKGWKYLDERVQQLIMSELEREFERDDKARATELYPQYCALGDNCDREAWEHVRNAYIPQLPKDAYYYKKLARDYEAIKKSNEASGDAHEDDDDYQGNAHS